MTQWVQSLAYDHCDRDRMRNRVPNSQSKLFSMEKDTHAFKIHIYSTAKDKV